MTFAARAIGHLAIPGGAFTAELVENEVRTSLEWLQPEPRQESRRFAAALCINELAKNSPTLLYAFVPQIFECIWVALHDSKILIRETAASAVGECFKIVAARETQTKSQWLEGMYTQLIEGLNAGSLESVHGSLLTLRELLERAGMFMVDHYREACDVCLKFKDHKDFRIRTLIVTIVPILAGFNEPEFARGYLRKFMVYLQGQLKKERERNPALLAIGKVAISVKGDIAPYLDNIIVFVREALSVKARNRASVDEGPVFNCISMLSEAVQQTLTKYMHALLDPMFACGLSQPLTEALDHLAHFVGPIKSQIQDKLLDLLSLVLSGRPYKPLGMPNGAYQATPTFARDLNFSTTNHDDNEVVLALTTLGSFDFGDRVLNDFIRNVVMRFVDSSNPEIRKAAAMTVSQMFIKDPIIHQTSSHAVEVVAEVVERLLMVGVADPDPNIRRAVLLSLDAKFNRHLSKPHNVDSLFAAAYDTNYGVKEAAIVTIGRLTSVNPAYIFPPLRVLLICLTSGIRKSNDPKVQEESTALIGLFILNAGKLVRPNIEPLVKCLLPEASNPNDLVASTAIHSLGQLSTVGGTILTPFVPSLMPTIIGAISDLSSTAKRAAAIQTLAQLAGNCGYVIQPYLDYPQLLNILIGIVKTEHNTILKRETVKLIGTLGALDPYKHQQIMEASPEHRLRQESDAVSDIALIMQGLPPSNEEYYPTVVMNTLMQFILKDVSLAQYHSAVMEAIVRIFQSLGLKCVPFLGQIIPSFISVMHAAPHSRLDLYFNHLAVLASIVRQHVRAFVPKLMSLIEEFWPVSTQVQVTILSLLEELARGIPGEFAGGVSRALPLMVQVLRDDEGSRRPLSEKILQTFLVFGRQAEHYMILILPILVDMIKDPENPQSLRKQAIEVIGKTSRQVNLERYIALILHNMCEVFEGKDPVIKQAAYDCILTLIAQTKYRFVVFSHMVRKHLVDNHFPVQKFDNLVAKQKAERNIPVQLDPELYTPPGVASNPMSEGQKKQLVNQEQLKSAWDASQKSTREDWQEWMRRFTVELLRQSPSNALRACAPLATLYQPLATELFNSAFVSCWTELYEQYQDELVRSIEKAISSPQIPPEVLQMLLNLAEFMEHDDKPLPVDIRELGMYAGRCHAFAKALHYKELEFEEEKGSGTVEALIFINNQLGQSDAAVGILRHAQKYQDFELKASWFEKLQRWDEALNSYERQEQGNVGITAPEVTMGKMRCLHALGEWEKLSNVAEEQWSLATPDYKKTIAPLAAAAAWGVGHWELMNSYIDRMKVSSPDRAFFEAILCVQRNSFDDARLHIEKARQGLDNEMSALLGESYTRAYGVVVRVQMLAELDEMLVYKQSSDDPVKQATMRETWDRRLRGCKREIDVWQRMLKIRALVVSPRENVDTQIKFANLCRKSGRIGLAEKTLRHLQDFEPHRVFEDGVPQVMYAQFKYSWATGKRQIALESLQTFTKNLTEHYHMVLTNQQPPQTGPIDPLYDRDWLSRGRNKSPPQDPVQLSGLLSKCFVKIGDWLSMAKNADGRSSYSHDIIKSYEEATAYNEKSYKAWHSFAMANFELIAQLSSQPSRDANLVSQSAIKDHVIPAMDGFFNSIALSPSSSLQDTLRLLTLLFSYGGDTEVQKRFSERFGSVNIDTWLDVIPQLVARINQPNDRVRSSVHGILFEVGKAHPQALVYPLAVAKKSNTSTRSKSAEKIVSFIKQRNAVLVAQAELVSNELIRVAVLWHELWHEGLEEASRLYFGDQDVDGMFAALQPLHEMIDRGPDTLREISFVQTFGRDLNDARDWCNKYRESEEPGDLNQAWDLYYSVFKRIARHLPHLIQLDLTYVSPKLKEARNLELAVPGTYQSGKPVVRIQYFDQIFHVIISKQRPRKMSLRGSDGVQYEFLLKGHEDIRQDQRVMQLFGLVNTLLANDTESAKRHLNIQAFPAIPLSQNSGLLGWVKNSDTLHNLVKEYRETRKILLNIEHRIMLQMAPDYDNLTLMQKVEVFGYAMDNTTGKDLYRVLWLKSKSSEAWLERRTTYTRSLAVMSMVGYILGLGDRHPSNLMLDRVTGKVVHIDFGDCFEIAMHREKYPERVPFRLTRMLTYAMEVSNIDGSYRESCLAIMRVIRNNKESLMAVLEAFIHDPLLNWRMGRNSPPSPSFPSERRQSILGMEQSDDPTKQLSQLRLNNSYRGAGRRVSALDQGVLDPSRDVNENREQHNARAVQVLGRVKEKLTGRDFGPREVSVEAQVARLIQQATNVENLCQHYIGWCSFW